ncbi:MAG TPA: SusC/RagA family TonB-linked outer membrane protein, partial [Puia sp.]
MKISLIPLLLFVLVLCSYAKDSSGQKILEKKITLKVADEEVRAVFTELEKRTEVKFVYSPELIESSRKVNLDVKEVELYKVLAELLSPLDLRYELVKNYVILARKEKSGSLQVMNFGEIPDNSPYAFVKVSGRVTGSNGAALEGVTVVVKGTHIGTTTNGNGDFSLNVPGPQSTLSISYIGYQDQELSIGSKTWFDVQLTALNNQLNDVIVVAYGTVRRQDITSSISVVNVADAKKTATYDVAKLLQGQAAGVTVHGSGEPGGYVQIKIRGVTTFGNNSPLFVIDGVPVDAPFDFSTDDIESIQVLKDATSAALYGARAATGIVVITTKKGRNGPARVTYNGYVGAQNVAKRIPVTDRAGYQKITSAAELNAGLTIAPGNDPNNPAYISNINTDWQKAGLKTGMITDHNVGVSGGNDVASYNLSLGYFDQTATQAGPQRYNRYTVNSGVQGRKGILSFGAKLAYTQSHKVNFAATNGHAVFGGTVTSMLTAIPTMPVYDPNRLGGYGGSDAVKNRAISLNVVGINDLVNDYSNRNRILANTWAEVEIVKNLKLKLNLSYDRTDWENFHFEPKFDLGFYYLNTQYYMFQQEGNTHTGLMENLLTYQVKFGEHKLDFLAGLTYQEDHNGYISATAQDTSNLPFQTFGYVSNPAAKGVTSFKEASTLQSYLGRINYNYGDRYLLTANFRRDGSSRFSPVNRYGNYASISAAWNIANEKFLHLPASVSSMKLRGGIGELGNANFGNYLFQSYINSNTSYVFNGQLVQGSTVVSVADPSLHWESTRTGNVAVDLGLFKEELTFTAEYYNRKSSGIITAIPIPLSVGAFPATLTTNAASMKNTGVEFTVNYHKVVKDVTLSIKGNVFTVRNKVLALGATNNPIYGSGSKSEVGRSLGDLYGFVTEGLYQDANDLTKHATQVGAALGDVKFRDINGSGAITDSDRVYLG